MEASSLEFCPKQMTKMTHGPARGGPNIWAKITKYTNANNNKKRNCNAANEAKQNQSSLWLFITQESHN